jgi:hypothetical protein
MQGQGELVFIHDSNAFGRLQKRGAYASLVEYSYEGVLFEEWISNDDFTIWSERNSTEDEDD